MTKLPVRAPRLIVLGAMLSLVAVLLGYGLGGVFGANEAALRSRLTASGTEVISEVYGNDQKKMEAVVSKSFTYLKRGHMHWGAIGAVGVAVAGFLLAVGGSGLLSSASALCVGAGSILYGLFWMLAGFAAPGLGGTSQAKDVYEFVAVPGAGLSLIGIVLALVVAGRELSRARS